MLVGCFVNVTAACNFYGKCRSFCSYSIKGSTFSIIIPIHDTFLLEQEDVPPQKPFGQGRNLLIWDQLTLLKNRKLRCSNCLLSLVMLFLSKGSLGRTNVVKPTISTEGRPNRQLPRRLPESLKAVVSSEVDKMLSQGVIWNSTSA